MSAVVKKTDGKNRNGETSKKGRFTVQLSAEVVREARDIVIAMGGPPIRLTLSGLVEKALLSEFKRLKKAHNKGQNFPRYSNHEKLRTGRPVR